MGSYSARRSLDRQHAVEGSIAPDRNLPRSRGKVCVNEGVNRPLHAVMHEASGIPDRSIHRETWRVEEPEPRDFPSMTLRTRIR